MKIRIIENQDDAFQAKRAVSELDLLLTPGGGFNNGDIIKALENSEFYGSYVSNMRNDKKEIEKALISHFGPNLPTHKKPLEKKQGFLFPSKTKQAVDNFIRTFDSKPNLLTYEVLNGKILFPTGKNTSKQNTQKVLKTVLDNAGIEYFLNEFEDLREFIKPLQEISRLKKLAGL